MATTSRSDEAMRRRGIRLAVLIVVWDVIEGAVAITAGLVTSTVILGSASLVTASAPAGGWLGSNVAAVRESRRARGL